MTTTEENLALLENARLSGWDGAIFFDRTGYAFQYVQRDGCTHEPRTIGAATATTAIAELVRLISERLT